MKAKCLVVLEGSYTALRAVGEELVRRYAPPDVARRSVPVWVRREGGGRRSVAEAPRRPAGVQAEGFE